MAHEDDDLLFLSPDLLRDIRGGRCVRTIFLTAGDAADTVAGGIDKRTKYWMAREAGNRAAYALMSGKKNRWTQSHILVSGHRIAMFTLSGDPKISEINLRLPDGYPDGAGAAAHHHESLLKLRDGEIRRIHAIDGSTSYTRAGLLATVTALVAEFHPGVIRTQNYVTPDFTLTPVTDHADHTAAAQIARAASDAYRTPHVLIGYVDYDTEVRPANLSGATLAAKQAAFYLYDQYDSLLPCYNDALRKKNSECNVYATWLTREYQVSAGPSWIQPCFVPQLAGFPNAFGGAPASRQAAVAAIRAAGCALGNVSEIHSNSVPADFVISQRPVNSPAFLPEGTKVSITVSSGP